MEHTLWFAELWRPFVFNASKFCRADRVYYLLYVDYTWYTSTCLLSRFALLYSGYALL